MLPSLKSIAIIGGHADVGMLSGGGSAQVDPPGGNAIMPPGKGATRWGSPVWFPTSPLKAIRAKAPGAKVEFDPGTDLNSAAALAKNSDVAIVFVSRWESEGRDADNMSLGDNQDDLVAKVAAANPHTIVVLETGNPVLMPWADNVSAILEAWFAGSSGDKALANILFGDVNPSGKLPITFPKSESDLPHLSIVKPPPFNEPPPRDPEGWKKRLEGLPAFQTNYDEGLKVGYKWYDAENKPVLFAFGHGLSYTTYSYSNLKVTPGDHVGGEFHGEEHRQPGGDGNRAGLCRSAREHRGTSEAAGGLEPGQARPGREQGSDALKSIRCSFRSSTLRITHGRELPGDYAILVGGASDSLPLHAGVSLK